MKKKFLVTGGAGFIGSHIAEELLYREKGDVVVLDNLSVGKRENIPPGATLIVGDIKDRTILRECLEGVDAVFHNAAFVSIRGSFDRLEDDLEINSMGTLNVLRESAAAKVRQFIFASSMAVYGAPENFPVTEVMQTMPHSPYGLSKVRGEMYCKIFSENFDIQTVILRYFNTYGPRQTPSAYVGVLTTFITQALQGTPMTVFGDGSQLRDFVSVKDVARANLKALDFPGRGIFNIGSGSEISVLELAGEIVKYLGEGSIAHLAPPQGEIPRMLADISKAQSLLDYKPEDEIKKTIPALIEEWKNKR
jgi:UDP-glucose 4-epimerase